MVDEKSLVKIDKKKDLDNSEFELKGIPKMRGDFEKALSDLKRKASIDNELWEIAKKNFKVLRPNWAYEETEEYHKKLLELKEIIQEEKNKQYTNEIERMEKVFKSMDEQEASLREHIKKLKEELGEEQWLKIKEKKKKPRLLMMMS